MDGTPDELSYEDVVLRYDKTVHGDPARGLVPFLHYRIIVAETDVGHINFKTGDTAHITYVAGHLGYEIRPEFRGRGLAYKACQALAPLVRKYYTDVIITVDPENHASIAVIKKLGATFLDKRQVPEQDPAYASGAREKLRYRWTL